MDESPTVGSMSEEIVENEQAEEVLGSAQQEEEAAEVAEEVPATRPPLNYG